MLDVEGPRPRNRRKPVKRQTTDAQDGKPPRPGHTLHATGKSSKASSKLAAQASTSPNAPGVSTSAWPWATRQEAVKEGLKTLGISWDVVGWDKELSQHEAALKVELGNAAAAAAGAPAARAGARMKARNGVEEDIEGGPFPGPARAEQLPQLAELQSTLEQLKQLTTVLQEHNRLIEAGQPVPQIPAPIGRWHPSVSPDTADRKLPSSVPSAKLQRSISYGDSVRDREGETPNSQSHAFKRAQSRDRCDPPSEGPYSSALAALAPAASKGQGQPAGQHIDLKDRWKDGQGPRTSTPGFLDWAPTEGGGSKRKRDSAEGSGSEDEDEDDEDHVGLYDQEVQVEGKRQRKPPRWLTEDQLKEPGQKARRLGPYSKGPLPPAHRSPPDFPHMTALAAARAPHNDASKGPHTSSVTSGGSLSDHSPPRQRDDIPLMEYRAAATQIHYRSPPGEPPGPRFGPSGPLGGPTGRPGNHKLEQGFNNGYKHLGAGRPGGHKAAQGAGNMYKQQPSAMHSSPVSAVGRSGGQKAPQGSGNGLKGPSSQPLPAGLVGPATYKPPITFYELVQAGYVKPGPTELVVGNGNVRHVTIKSDGSILYNQSFYDSVSSFAVHVLREVNPGRKAADGWREIKYKGLKLNAIRKKLTDKQAQAGA